LGGRAFGVAQGWGRDVAAPSVVPEVGTGAKAIKRILGGRPAMIMEQIIIYLKIHHITNTSQIYHGIWSRDTILILGNLSK
jgi:hypothetical protein